MRGSRLCKRHLWIWLILLPMYVVAHQHITIPLLEKWVGSVSYYCSLTHADMHTCSHTCAHSHADSHTVTFTRSFTPMRILTHRHTCTQSHLLAHSHSCADKHTLTQCQCYIFCIVSDNLLSSSERWSFEIKTAQPRSCALSPGSSLCLPP